MKKFFLLMVVCVCIIFVGCEMPKRQPLTVTFVDISGALSTDHTIKISFAEEKDYDNYFIDILVKSDTNVELTLFQEFASDDDKIKLSLVGGGEYVSLDEYKLFNMEKEQTDSMVGYSDALVTNLVVNSDKNAKLTFLAVIGENIEGNFKQIGEVSKEYTLNVLEHNSI